MRTHFTHYTVTAVLATLLISLAVLISATSAQAAGTAAGRQWRQTVTAGPPAAHPAGAVARDSESVTVTRQPSDRDAEKPAKTAISKKAKKKPGAKRKKKTKKKPLAPVSVSVTQTSQDLRQALSRQRSLRFSATARPTGGIPIIKVNDRRHYQWFTGVGGGMTDTSTWLIWTKLPPAARSQVLSTLFSSSGANLGFLRVPIGGSDFTHNGVPYTYDDLPAGQTDPGLTRFSVAHDEPYILPALRAARHLNPNLYLEAVPWSPPAWMKANGALDDVGHAGPLLPQDYPTFAQYFVKFLRAYRAQGVPVDAIAPANEPEVPTTYSGLDFSEGQQANFVANYLRPALATAGLFPNVFGWDLAWAPLNPQADPLVDQAASGTLTGLSWHCYYGSPTYMTGVHLAAVNSMQIVDECTTGSGDIFPTSELLISSTRNWANAVALWNLALDPQGGPVQAPNSGCVGCTGLVTINEQTGTYTLSRDYYELAQFSHFIHRGAVRIASPHFVAYGLGMVNDYQTVISPGLDDVAYLNPDGTRVLYLYNNAAAPITFAVRWDRRDITYTIPPQATTTLAWK